MKSTVTLLSLVFFSLLIKAQVGINTTDPKGTLDVTSVNNTGLVIPRVANVESVTDGNGNPPVDGTTVFDLSRNSTCFYQNSRWVCIEEDSSGQFVLNEIINISYDSSSNIDYIKASNTATSDYLGWIVSLSDDGNTMAVASRQRSSNAGAAYVFIRTGTTWSQQAFITASNANNTDFFSNGLSLSGDGNTLAVGAFGEDSNATGINGNEADNSASSSGAVYVFIRTGTTWSQESYIKASNAEGDDDFGWSVALSYNGNTLAVGARSEASSATGVNGDETNNSASNSGASYIFTRVGTTWSQEAYLKASNTNGGGFFGHAVALSDDGNTLAVGANFESTTILQSGAVYVFTRSGITWSQEAFLKASNPGNGYTFGDSISFSSDGNIMAVGAMREGSATSGIDGDQTDTSAYGTGAVYLLSRSGTTWTQTVYFKASNPGGFYNFGYAVSLSNNGNALLVGCNREDSNATGINGDQNNTSASNSGAAYIFINEGGVWTQNAYIKASNTNGSDRFGTGISISGTGELLAIGAYAERSNATGINGDQTNNSLVNAGAVYVYSSN
ncbi:MAG: hypothetical protein AB8B65_06750 [Kordia sp.]|uniref:hypothetical protein n=1 Tax=Kordia sp. TaxID=1965332 RepID=UPI003857F59F